MRGFVYVFVCVTLCASVSECAPVCRRWCAGAASGVVKPAVDVVAGINGAGDGSVASFLDSLKTDESCGTMKDIKSLVKTMTVGLKTVMWCIVNIGRGAQEGAWR